MGKGYFILVWDGWGSGLVRINPRLHTDGTDMYGNPQNWWPCDDTATEAGIADAHELDDLYEYYRVYIR